jgi:Mg-chelatase subunit ChlD
MPSNAQHAVHEPTSRRTTGTVAAVTAGMVVLSGILLANVGTADDRTQACSEGERALRVAASPDLAPVLAEAVERSTSLGPCRPVVRADDPAVVLDNLLDGSAPAPDVWVPDSTRWLERAGHSVPEGADAGSIAHTPLVLALSASTGRAVLGSGRADDLTALLPTDAPPPVRLDLADPHRSSSTTGALLALSTALAGRADARPVMAGLLRSATVQVGGSERRAPVVVPDGAAVPTTEQAVAASPPSTLVALPATGPGTTFDYPFAVLATSRERRAQARELHSLLAGASGQDLVEAAGFRTARGPAPAPAAPPAAVAAAEAMLAAVKQDARLLTVLDVSGSMSTPVPGAGGATRLTLAKQAAERGLSLYPDTSEVGLWAFSTRLVGDLDHREIVPMSRLGSAGDPVSGRARLFEGLDGLAAVPNGDTGLHDTVLAAVRAQQRSWDPQRINAVLLLTDGRNDDDAGLSVDQLLQTLAAERDPRRPVPVIALAYGPDSDVSTLRRITDATAGSTYAAVDPRSISQVLLDAMGQRSCRPACGRT